MRLIDADRLKAVLEKNFGHTGGASVLEQLIDEQPTIEPSTNCSEIPNNSDAVSRQAAIDALDCINGTEEVLRSLPSAQPETAKRIVGKSRDGMTLWYQCDMCNEPVDAQDDYCRGCGRRLIDG